MKLIIGGAFQGKRDAACRLYNLNESDLINGEDCSKSDLLKAKAVFNYHLFLRQCMKAGQDPYEITKEILSELPDLIIISDEVGYGIVPLDPFDREWREKCGRSCCMIAEASDTVIRVIAGNVCTLKGEK